MKQKPRMFIIHQTATSLQQADNLNPRTRWYPALDEWNRMISAYFTLHLGKNPPPQNGCRLTVEAPVSHPPLSLSNRTFHKTNRAPSHWIPALPGHWFESHTVCDEPLGVSFFLLTYDKVWLQTQLLRVHNTLHHILDIVYNSTSKMPTLEGAAKTCSLPSSFLIRSIWVPQNSLKISKPDLGVTLVINSYLWVPHKVEEANVDTSSSIEQSNQWTWALEVWTCEWLWSETKEF
jgi:hypothetical protein